MTRTGIRLVECIVLGAYVFIMYSLARWTGWDFPEIPIVKFATGFFLAAGILSIAGYMLGGGLIGAVQTDMARSKLIEALKSRKEKENGQDRASGNED